jgi:hypothetical protein
MFSYLARKAKTVEEGRRQRADGEASPKGRGFNLEGDSNPS